MSIYLVGQEWAERDGIYQPVIKEEKKIKVVYVCEECGKINIRWKWEHIGNWDDPCDFCGEWLPFLEKLITD